MNHTPTPWKYTDDRYKEDPTLGTFSIRDEKDDVIAQCQPYSVAGWKEPEETKANTEFIILAVNMLEELVILLRRTHEAIAQAVGNEDGLDGVIGHQLMMDIQKVLAKL